MSGKMVFFVIITWVVSTVVFSGLRSWARENSEPKEIWVNMPAPSEVVTVGNHSYISVHNKAKSQYLVCSSDDHQSRDKAAWVILRAVKQFEEYSGTKVTNFKVQENPSGGVGPVYITGVWLTHEPLK